MEPLPSEYATLSRWFPALSQRARALGLSRETLTRWERASSPPRVRPGTARAVRSLASVAEDVERLVDDPSGAGAWLLAPQPALRGAPAARLAVAATPESLALLRSLVFAGASSNRLGPNDATRRAKRDAPPIPTIPAAAPARCVHCGRAEAHR
jgi:hypothetical protein